MTDLNHVSIIGRLTGDAEVKSTKTGTPAVRFTIATNRTSGKGDQRTEETGYFKVIFYGKSAEAVSKYLVKGKQVAIDGELHQLRWDRQDGEHMSIVEIVVRDLQLLGGKSDKDGVDKAGNSGRRKVNAAPPEPDCFDDDGIPF